LFIDEIIRIVYSLSIIKNSRERRKKNARIFFDIVKFVDCMKNNTIDSSKIQEIE